jgi:hypothetical protein
MAKLDELLESMKSIKGLQVVFLMAEEVKFQLLEVETDAEKRAFMGLGMCYNSGVREVLRRPIVLAVITNMDFDWGCQAHMVLKKDDVVVGEEVLESKRIEELEKRDNILFLHKNFVIYKDKVNFPTDLVENKCCFDLPALTLYDEYPQLRQFGDHIVCFPSSVGDIFLKKAYYGGVDERGMGTALFGFKLKE